MTVLDEQWTIRPLPPLPLTAEPVATSLPQSRRDPDDDLPAHKRRAAAESPVGRAVAREKLDPSWNHPLRRLEDRLGRPLLDLGTITDAELNELAGLVLAEKIRRDQRWLS